MFKSQYFFLRGTQAPLSHMWLISASVWNKSVPHMSFCPYFCRCSISRRTWIRLWCTIWRLLRLPKTSPGRVNREKMIETNSLSSPVLIIISLKFLMKNNQEENCISQKLLFDRSVDLQPKYCSLFTHTQGSAFSARELWHGSESSFAEKIVFIGRSMQ